MSDIPNRGKPDFVAEKPEQYYACYRLIRPGETYYLTIDNIMHCKDPALSRGVIRVRDDLAVEVKRNRLLTQRDNAGLAVFPGENQQPMNALPEAAVHLAKRKVQGGQDLLQ